MAVPESGKYAVLVDYLIIESSSWDYSSPFSGNVCKGISGVDRWRWIKAANKII
jgi:hypothetical protein